jgi:hypothetical protein
MAFNKEKVRRMYFKTIICPRLIFPLLLIVITYTLSGQRSDSTISKGNSYGGAVTIQSKGISTIPNLTLGKPAAIFDLKMGRKLTFEPQFRFSLEGKPWAMVFWWRYYGSVGDKFKVTLHTNYSLAYKSLNYYTSSGIEQEIIRTTSYLVAAVQPNYQINKYVGVGLYIFYNHGLESYITQNTVMLSLRSSFSNIPITKNISGRINPEIYYLKMDDNDGVFFTTRFLISKKNFPLSVSGLITQPLRSSIPSDYDFIWNVGLSYTFNNKYIQAP